MMKKSAGLLKVHFSKEEDKKLRSLVNVHGTSNWKVISKMMPGRNHRQCKDRWEKFLAPHINHAPFSPAEDELILMLCQQHGSKWTSIAKLFNGRSDASLKSRYKVLMRRIVDPNSKLISPPPVIPEIPTPDPEILDSMFNFDDDFTEFNFFVE